MLIGYARVSTRDQDLEAQLAALRKVGITSRRLYCEKISATAKDRPQLEAMLGSLREGDIVCVSRLDRLARSLTDLFTILDAIEGQGARLRSLGEPFDTSTDSGRLAVQMLMAVADYERRLARARAMEGIAHAQASGTHCGRPPLLNPTQQAQLAKRWQTARYSKAELGRMYGIKVKTVNRYLTAAGLDPREPLPEKKVA